MSHRFAALALAATLSLIPICAQAQVVVRPPDAMVSIDEARDIASEYGLRQIESMQLEQGDRRWEIDGRDVEGRWVEMDIDANPGAVVRIDR